MFYVFKKYQEGKSMKNLIDKCNNKQISFAITIFSTIKNTCFESKEEAFEAMTLLMHILNSSNCRDKMEEVLKYIFDKQNHLQFEQFKSEYLDDLILYKENK